MLCRVYVFESKEDENRENFENCDRILIQEKEDLILFLTTRNSIYLF
jgi:hypothetical protein